MIKFIERPLLFFLRGWAFTNPNNSQIEFGNKPSPRSIVSWQLSTPSGTKSIVMQYDHDHNMPVAQAEKKDPGSI